MRYIAVFHSWFVYSKGFTIMELPEAKTKGQAETAAAVILHDKDAMFKKTSFQIIEIASTERISRLTWRERFTGRIQQQHNTVVPRGLLEALEDYQYIDGERLDVRIDIRSLRSAIDFIKFLLGKA